MTPGFRGRARWLAIVLAIVHLSLLIAAVSHHEPWRDEADAWLSVRDQALVDVIARLDRAGTPPLWYCLLNPLVRLGMPYGSMLALNALFAFLAVLLLLFVSPIPRIVLALLPFSYYFLFEYGVVARNYAIGILLLFLAAALHSRRSANPLPVALALALAMQTSVHAAIIASALGATFVLEVFSRRTRTRLDLVAVALFAISAALLAIVLWPSPGSQFESPLLFERGWAPVEWALRHAFFPRTSAHFASLWSLGLLVGAAAVTFLVEGWRSRVTAALAIGGLLCLFAFVYSSRDAYRHFGVVLIAVVVAMWISPPSRTGAGQQAAAWIFAASLFFSLFTAIEFVQLEWSSDYSGAKRAAVAVERLAGNRPIAAFRSSQSSALLPYLPDRRFYYLGEFRWGTFMLWDMRYVDGTSIPAGEAVEIARDAFRPEDRPLILLTERLTGSAAEEVRLLWSQERPVFEKVDEQFYLYEFRR